MIRNLLVKLIGYVVLGYFWMIVILIIASLVLVIGPLGWLALVAWLLLARLPESFWSKNWLR